MENQGKFSSRVVNVVLGVVQLMSIIQLIILTRRTSLWLLAMGIYIVGMITMFIAGWCPRPSKLRWILAWVGTAFAVVGGILCIVGP